VVRPLSCGSQAAELDDDPALSYPGRNDGTVHAMPLRPLLLDLREHRVCERPVRFLLSLKRLAPGETLLVVCDDDPGPLLQELKPVLEKSFTCWTQGAGPDIWRILISRGESQSDFKEEPY
jgi:uncharacterized protein (DUF2249 family)